ncbi:MAG: hypothetical protein AB7N24_10730 [Dehalococcoidia bacterium]
MATRPAEPQFELGPLVASYGWGISSRAGAVFLGLMCLLPGCGWVAWELHDYGEVSVGGALLLFTGSATGALALWYSLFSRSNPALELFEYGLVSHLHRADSCRPYTQIAWIQPMWRNHRWGNWPAPWRYVLLLVDGSAIHIHSIAHMRTAIREIQARSGAQVDVPDVWREGFSL